MDMIKYESLIEYILINHRDDICAALIQYFKDQELYAYKEEYDNSDVNMFSIGINILRDNTRYFKAPGDLIDLDVEMDLAVEVTSMVGDELETNRFEDTYTLRITAELNNGLHNFKVNSVRYGSHQRDFDCEYSLSEFLTPYIRTQDKERYATDFLKKYYPEALEQITFINPITLLDRMKLTLYFAKLENGIDGRIIFSDEIVEVFDSKNKIFRRVQAHAGTILLNIDLIDKGRGCVNNTIIHECVHWWLHKKHFELLRLLNPNDPDTKSYVDEMELPDKRKFMNKYYMELQARSLSPLILMPQKSASEYYETILHQLESRRSYHSKTKTFLYALYKFADKFGASTSCARIRLETLGYTEVAFSSKIGNDLNIKPFKSSIRLETGQTYILEFAEAMKAFRKDTKLKIALVNGKILYVDGLFVVNDEKYIHFYKTAKPRLTELALSDVSKCCILFDTKKEGVSINFDPATFNFGTFCSGGSRTQYSNNPSVANNANNVELLDNKRSSIHSREEIEEAREFISKMNQYVSFSEKLDCLLGDECMCCRSDRSIGSACHIDGKTITSYRDGSSRPDEKKLIAICAGLKLHPLVSLHLLKANRIEIVGIIEDPFPFYFQLISSYYPYGLDAWNEMIRDAYPDHLEYVL